MIRPVPFRKPKAPHLHRGLDQASAVRAARLGDNDSPALPGLTEVYEAERQKLGLPIPPRPLAKGPLFLWVTDDPERDWPIVAPHVIYTSNSNKEWAKERGVGDTPYKRVEGVDDLKAARESRS